MNLFFLLSILAIFGHVVLLVEILAVFVRVFNQQSKSFKRTGLLSLIGLCAASGYLWHQGGFWSALFWAVFGLFYFSAPPIRLILLFVSQSRVIVKVSYGILLAIASLQILMIMGL